MKFQTKEDITVEFGNPDPAMPLRNFIDGRKSILQIRDAVAAEAAFMNLPAPSVTDVEGFIKLLEKFGYVKLAVGSR
jgi:hypothetical protein